MKVRFETRTVADHAKGPSAPTAQVEYVIIEMPGSKDVVERASTPADRHRFKVEHAAFLKAQTKPAKTKGA